MSYEERRPLRQRGQLSANIVAKELLHQRKSVKRNSLPHLSIGNSYCHTNRQNSHLMNVTFFVPAPAQKPVRTLNKQKGTASLQGLQKPLVTKNEAAPPKPVRQLRKRSKSNGEAMDVDSLPQVKPSKSISLLTSDTLGCQGHN